MTFKNFLLAISAGGFAWASLYVTVQCAGHQLTVEEADRGLTVACELLARTMAKETPEKIDAVVAQACQPGKTRQLIARVLAKKPPVGTEWLDADPGAPGAFPGDRGGEPSPSSKPPPRPEDLLDAGAR